MSSSLVNNAADDPSRIMTAAQTTLTAHTTQSSKRQPPICLTDEEAVVSAKDKKDNMASDSPRRKVDKRSTEYVIKSGLAGGLAGCAVCCHLLIHISPVYRWQQFCKLTFILIGQNGSRSPRPRENPLPNK